MKLFAVGPREIHRFATVREFAEEFAPSSHDLIISIHPIWNAFIEPLSNGAHALLLDDYGSQEPTDEMIDRVIADATPYHADRIIAIGGGAVMDVAKVVAIADGRGIDEVIDGIGYRGYRAGGFDARSCAVLIALDQQSPDIAQGVDEADDHAGDPLDKAGAYGIQGPGLGLVERIDGCYYAVAGLPVSATLNLLQKHGAP